MKNNIISRNVRTGNQNGIKALDKGTTGIWDTIVEWGNMNSLVPASKQNPVPANWTLVVPWVATQRWAGVALQSYL